MRKFAINPPHRLRFGGCARIGVGIRPAIFALAILAPLYCPAIERPDAGEPTQIVDALHGALIELASHSAALTDAARFRQLEPAIRSSHDFSTIARLVGGRFWKNLSDGQRSLFVEAFCRASIATYASRFASAQGVSFAQATLLESSGDRVRIHSELVDADGSRIRFEYVLHDLQGQWLIIIILVDGVSDLALQRAELTRVYADTGFAGVMEHLEAAVEAGY